MVCEIQNDQLKRKLGPSNIFIIKAQQARMVSILVLFLLIYELFL